MAQVLYDAAGEVSRDLMRLADELRAAGKTREAARCDAMSQRLSRALHDALTETQPLTLPIERKK